MKKKLQATRAANLGFETNLWAAADSLRTNTDAAEHKHVVLGLIFLKHDADAFEAKHAEFDAQSAHDDTFRNDRHPDMKADCMPANPPFNDCDWRDALLKDDQRWAYGMPPAGNGFSDAISAHQRQAA